MSLYDKGNLFVGKYKIPEDGHVRLANPKIRILYGIVDEDFGWGEAEDGDPWLIVEDGSFWPVMIKLDETTEPWSRKT